MNDTIFESAKNIVNQYNPKLNEYGVEITVQRRSFTEEVDTYNHYGRYGILNFLEYIFINKKIEEKKYKHIPNRFELLILQVNPIKSKKSKDNKKYAFLVRQIARAHEGDKPIERHNKEQYVIAKIEKRLKRLLKKAEKASLPDWCRNTLLDSLRYTFTTKYKYLENFCGKSRFFWEIFWICVIGVPVLLFAIGGLINSLLH